MSKNITYLLGAGASYHACPIWKEQGVKMIELATKFYSNENVKFTGTKPKNLSDSDSILWDIGYFGQKAIEFGTIDTYAKKLYLNNSNEDDLQRLKLAVSMFFTLWESSDDKIKNRKFHQEIEPYKEIDPRYISLLASLLENNENNNLKIKDNIKFVTWNYDLQFERAFKSFCPSHQSWDDISSHLSFRINSQNNKRLNVCHLNGYSGFYNINKHNTQKEYHYIDRSESKKIDEILNEINFVCKSLNRGDLYMNHHINYAWENNGLAEKIRDEAKKIFQETDILIIIGYSFPPFNKDIDSLLFSELKNRPTEIYYQDINASKDYLDILTNGFECKITLIKDKVDHFYLPYTF